MHLAVEVLVAVFTQEGASEKPNELNYREKLFVITEQFRTNQRTLKN